MSTEDNQDEVQIGHDEGQSVDANNQEQDKNLHGFDQTLIGDVEKANKNEEVKNPENLEVSELKERAKRLEDELKAMEAEQDPIPEPVEQPKEEPKKKLEPPKFLLALPGIFGRIFSVKHIVTFVVVVVVVSIPLTYLFVFYLPNTPDNVWKTGFSRTGAGFSSIANKLTTEGYLGFDDPLITTTGRYTTNDQIYKVSSTTKVDKFDKDSVTDITLEGTIDKENKVTSRTSVLTVLPANAFLPNFYFRSTNLKDLKIEEIENIKKFQDTWILADQSYFKQVEDAFSGDSRVDDSQYDYKETMRLFRVASNLINKYIFTETQASSIIQQKSFELSEYQDGLLTFKYKAQFDPRNVFSMCQEAITAMANEASVKRMVGLNDQDYEVFVNQQRERCQPIAQSLGDISEFDVWIDKSTKTIYKMRFTDPAIINLATDYPKEIKTSGYLEFGQKILSQDEIEPFYNYQFLAQDATGKAVKKTAVLANFALNHKQMSGDGRFYFANKEQDSTVIKLDINLSTNSENIVNKLPAETAPVKDLIKSLIGYEVPFKPPQEVVNDNIRRSEINALYSAMQAYYSKNGFYPTIKELNDKPFREQNFPDLVEDVFSDPTSSTPLFDTRVSPNIYTYLVVPIGCNNKRLNCEYFELTATLSDGKLYTRKSQ